MLTALISAPAITRRSALSAGAALLGVIAAAAEPRSHTADELERVVSRFRLTAI